MISSEGWLGWPPLLHQIGRLLGTFILIKKLRALLSLAVVFGGSLALSTESVEAKTSRNTSPRTRNFLVPPPPPYIPTVIPSALAMSNAQALAAVDYYAVVEKDAKTSRNSSHRARNYFV